MGHPATPVLRTAGRATQYSLLISKQDGNGPGRVVRCVWYDLKKEDLGAFYSSSVTSAISISGPSSSTVEVSPEGGSESAL
mmetsp:Transcript_37504/g.63904  ORF Transcript_37504/g.63904 Transcript_37504/m.63904 type:complete len:81 (+) Transcript_37504:238-480(+)